MVPLDHPISMLIRELLLSDEWPDICCWRLANEEIEEVLQLSCIGSDR